MSFISSFEVIDVVIPDPNFLHVSASAATAGNPNGIKSF